MVVSFKTKELTFKKLKYCSRNEVGRSRAIWRHVAIYCRVYTSDLCGIFNVNYSRILYFVTVAELSHRMLGNIDLSFNRNTFLVFPLHTKDFEYSMTFD
ncbi:hypothetical protein C0J52_22864 [Blattella germanica]|nr:hypothetical protein C0J52_22864 [Blattella germanica]